MVLFMHIVRAAAVNDSLLAYAITPTISVTPFTAACRDVARQWFASKASASGFLGCGFQDEFFDLGMKAWFPDLSPDVYRQYACDEYETFGVHFDIVTTAPLNIFNDLRGIYNASGSLGIGSTFMNFRSSSPWGSPRTNFQADVNIGVSNYANVSAWINAGGGTNSWTETLAQGGNATITATLDGTFTTVFFSGSMHDEASFARSSSTARQNFVEGSSNYVDNFENGLIGWTSVEFPINATFPTFYQAGGCVANILPTNFRYGGEGGLERTYVNGDAVVSIITINTTTFKLFYNITEDQGEEEGRTVGDPPPPAAAVATVEAYVRSPFSSDLAALQTRIEQALGSSQVATPATALFVNATGAAARSALATLYGVLAADVRQYELAGGTLGLVVLTGAPAELVPNVTALPGVTGAPQVGLVMRYAVSSCTQASAQAAMASVNASFIWPSLKAGCVGSAAPSAAAPSAESDKSSTMKIGIAVGGVVLVLGLGFCYVRSRSQRTPADNGAVPTNMGSGYLLGSREFQL